ncbi:MAG: hypothetical protein H6621_06395 [Halobacteriovoraceae bacterium]|nr:hypothetical protein [Halobacteriovoraceae bacterium]
MKLFITLLFSFASSLIFANSLFLTCDYGDNRSIHFVRNADGYQVWVKNHETELLDHVSHVIAEKAFDFYPEFLTQDITISVDIAPDQYIYLIAKGLNSSTTLFRGELEILLSDDDEFRNIDTKGIIDTNCYLE